MRNNGQKSLRDYFLKEKQTTSSSSPSARHSSYSSPSGGKRTLPDDEVEPLCSTPARKKPSVIVIDSDIDDDEENIFKRSTKYRNPNVLHMPVERDVYCYSHKKDLPSSTKKQKTTRCRPARWSCSLCTYNNHPLISYCEMCSASRDRSSTESSATSHSDSAATLCDIQESILSSQNSVNCLSSSSRETLTQLPSLFSESNTDDVSEMTDCTAMSSAVGDTSLLKTLSIDSDEPTTANFVSDLCEDKQRVTGTKAELNIDFTNMTVHELFQFSCSRNSSRIYVYDKVHYRSCFTYGLARYCVGLNITIYQLVQKPNYSMDSVSICWSNKSALKQVLLINDYALCRNDMLFKSCTLSV